MHYQVSQDTRKIIKRRTLAHAKHEWRVSNIRVGRVFDVSMLYLS